MRIWCAAGGGREARRGGVPDGRRDGRKIREDATRAKPCACGAALVPCPRSWSCIASARGGGGKQRGRWRARVRDVGCLQRRKRYWVESPYTGKEAGNGISFCRARRHIRGMRGRNLVKISTYICQSRATDCVRARVTDAVMWNTMAAGC